MNIDRPIRINSLRLSGFNYSKPGAYFVTICKATYKIQFGEIVNASVILSPFGNVIEEHWKRIPARFPDIVVDEFIVMPDHLHGILFLQHNSLKENITGDRDGSPLLLSEVVHWFKTMTTNACYLLLKEKNQLKKLAQSGKDPT